VESGARGSRGELGAHSGEIKPSASRPLTPLVNLRELVLHTPIQAEFGFQEPSEQRLA
jgi:hypothetical protein